LLHTGKQTTHTCVDRTAVLASTLPYDISLKLVLQTSVTVVTLLVIIITSSEYEIFLVTMKWSDETDDTEKASSSKIKIRQCDRKNLVNAVATELMGTLAMAQPKILSRGPQCSWPHQYLAHTFDITNV